MQNVEFLDGEDYGNKFYISGHEANEINKKIHLIHLKLSWIIG